MTYHVAQPDIFFVSYLNFSAVILFGRLFLANGGLSFLSGSFGNNRFFSGLFCFCLCRLFIYRLALNFFYNRCFFSCGSFGGLGSGGFGRFFTCLSPLNICNSLPAARYTLN